MFDFLGQISELMPVYMLVFVRLFAMLISMPVLGFKTVSVRIRIVLALTLMFIIAPPVTKVYSVTYTSYLPLLIDITREIFVGLLIGFGARLIFEGFSIAGSFVGMQMGMAIMNVLDPGSQEQQPIVSNFWVMIIVILFLVTNSHYFLIEILFYNFKAISPGSAVFKPGAAMTLIHGGTIMFDLALKFAAPAMIFLLTLDTAIAFMARVMPQLNVFFISLPLKIGAGIFLLMLSLQIFQSLFAYVMDNLQVVVMDMIRGI